jgi:hypothetical protein
MKADELKAQMQAWELNAAELAKVLCLHTTKISEYLADVERIPCAIEFSIDALSRLPEDERNALIQERIHRKKHTRS